ncbi:Zinc finger X-linked protein ZXDA [Frankliniella fusca]|uniref:Zinc finger X-linked protein ZXDA n=1 Tax=Frankliniella fusca TaxID=407009 RepID=A0AAE1HNZ5_9NEOP|nr:Zinc finger X-linked protein ZXDA [Frankliniella fusca]
MTERSRQQQYKLSISHAQNYVSRKRELALENDRRFILNNQQKQYDPIAEEIARKKWLKCQKEYELAIRQYHSHVCNCCGRIMRISQLKILSKNHLQIDESVLKKVFYINQSESAKFCKTCASYIQKSKIPRMDSTFQK